MRLVHYHRRQFVNKSSSCIQCEDSFVSCDIIPKRFVCLQLQIFYWPCTHEFIEAAVPLQNNFRPTQLETAVPQKQYQSLGCSLNGFHYCGNKQCIWNLKFSPKRETTLVWALWWPTTSTISVNQQKYVSGMNTAAPKTSSFVLWAALVFPLIYTKSESAIDVEFDNGWCWHWNWYWCWVGTGMELVLALIGIGMWFWAPGDKVQAEKLTLQSLQFCEPAWTANVKGKNCVRYILFVVHLKWTTFQKLQPNELWTFTRQWLPAPARHVSPWKMHSKQQSVYSHLCEFRQQYCALKQEGRTIEKFHQKKFEFPKICQSNLCLAIFAI